MPDAHQPPAVGRAAGRRHGHRAAVSAAFHAVLRLSSFSDVAVLSARLFLNAVPSVETQLAVRGHSRRRSLRRCPRRRPCRQPRQPRRLARCSPRRSSHLRLRCRAGACRGACRVGRARTALAFTDGLWIALASAATMHESNMRQDYLPKPREPTDPSDSASRSGRRFAFGSST